MKMGGFWKWFCGEALDIGTNASDTIQDWLNTSEPTEDVCVINFITTMPHLLFTIASSLTLVCLSCTWYKNTECLYLRKFPCHTFRWISLVIVVFLCACSIAEGVLSDLTYHSISTTQPHLYIPSAFAFWAAIFSLVYYQHCEMWHTPRLSWLPLIYWILAFSGEVLKLRNQHQSKADVDTQLILVFRYDVVLMSALIYLTMLMLEIIVLCSKVSFHESIPTEQPDMRYYANKVNPLSYTLFYWINELLKVGYKHPLEMKDLGSLPVVHQAKYNYRKLRRVFKKEMEAATNHNREPSLWKVYCKTYPLQLVSTAVTKIISDIVIFGLPFTLNAITSYAERREQGDVDEVPQTIPHYITVKEFFSNVYVLAVFFCLAAFVQFFLLQTHFYECSIFGVHIRSSIQALVYEKSLRISNLSGGSLTVGEITNHMSTDAMNLLNYAQKMHLTWAAPERVLVVLGLLYYNVGISAILGLLSIFIILPVQSIIVKKSSKYQKEALKFSDERLKKSSEMLHGIKLLKLYGWENMYLNLIEAVRKKELKSILKFNIQFGHTVCLCFALPIALNIVIFGTYPSLSGKVLTSSVAFTTFVLINLIVDPIYNLPVVLSNLVNAIVVTKRLQKFFLAPEIEKAKPITEDEDSKTRAPSSTEQPLVKLFSWRRRWKGLSSSEEDDDENDKTTSLLLGETNRMSPAPEDDDTKAMALKITGGIFTWDRESTTPILKNINVAFPAGKLVMIVGTVGSGKSSLLSAIIGEMTTLKGKIQFSNKSQEVSYTAQKAWMINATLRENILFGQPFDKERYQNVIDACCLQQDLDILPAGDLTEIGEKGINLSGGQKQRVSVARAMYSDKDIVLLDDPLSALDVHVGDHLFSQGIKTMLLKSKRTVVLVTHQLQHLQYADLILVMKDGSISHKGTFDEITAKDPNLFTDSNVARDSTSESDTELDEERKTRREQMRQKTLLTIADNTNKDDKINHAKAGQLMQVEELERGAVSYKVYVYLLRSMGWPIIVAYIVSRILQEVANIGRQFWLANWAEAGVAINTTANFTEEVNTNFYIAGYAWISLALVVTTAMMAFTAVTAMYLAAKRIHIDMIRNIFGSPMRFFDTTPAGRILNRLSSDTQIIDTKLLVTYTSFMYYLVALPAYLVAIAIVTPIFLVEILPLVFVYYFLQKYFIRSSRELQRLDSTTRSPVFAHFSETLGGLSTIRAYGEEERFFNMLLEKIDTNNTAYIYLQAGYSWIGSQLNFVSLAIMLMASLTTVITMETSGLSSSFVGLSLSYAVSVTYFLTSVLRHSAETEIQMNAAERVRHYTRLGNEDPSGEEPPSNWPHQGEIKIEDICVRYARHLPPVLKSVTIHVRPGEKVGVCGRTGSGKSSLTLTLFRLIDTFQGRIIIDGEDIARLPLGTLRRRLSIIPQDPILFTGTIRENLDPERTKTDNELWNALETAQLKELVSQLGTGLDYEVSEGGENFSVGQRQLFCLARAFLRNSRIIVMDEATASIDYDTEKVLQTVVTSAFLDKTVITIAHRVSTIINSDAIIVLNEGEIAEHDTPQALLSRETSIFASLVKANK